MAIVTSHGSERMRERMGLNKKSLDEVCNKALSRGIKHGDTSGALRKYLDGIYMSHRHSNNTRIYNHKVFVFNGEILITVLNLPNRFKGQVNNINKRKEG